jgi:hypothetical protein
MGSSVSGRRSPSLERRLGDIVLSDPTRGRVLAEVHELALPQSLVAAGFVRNAVWDALHGYPRPTPLNDVDVIFFDALADSDDESEAARRLARSVPGQRFSVKNQARMHIANHDPPYASTVHAMTRWPERCTAVGVSLAEGGCLEIAAPFGLDDVFDLVVRPTRPRMARLVADRVRDKRWLSIWPRLTVRDA